MDGSRSAGFCDCHNPSFVGQLGQPAVEFWAEFHRNSQCGMGFSSERFFQGWSVSGSIRLWEQGFGADSVVQWRPVLGIFQRFFSKFRITTNGGQCMSCGNCSTYCEMGIDVRSYASERRKHNSRLMCGLRNMRGGLPQRGC